MKASLPHIFAINRALLFLCFAVVFTTTYGSASGAPVNDSIVVQKKVSNRYHRVALYPDAIQKVLFFSVKGEHGKVYHLYLFDIDGKLVTQREIRNKQTTFISDFDKGLYLYDVFCDDERIGNGEIAVR